MAEVTGIDVSQIKFPAVMDLRTAAIYLEIGEMRIRTLARDEDLASFKNDAGHWRFNLEDLKSFKETMGTRKSGMRRGDRKFWRIQVKHDDLEAVKAALAKFSVEVQDQYQYEKKDKSAKAPKAAKEEKKSGVFGGGN